MASKQVYIGKVAQVLPIPDADKIEAVVVVCGSGGRWCSVVQKGQMNIGDSCQVYLQDSLLPQTEEFAFMERYSYRVRMAKFRGMPSEALIMPQTLDGQARRTSVECRTSQTEHHRPCQQSGRAT